MSWESLIDEGAVGLLLEGEYARYRRPVSEALSLFIKGLSATRRETVLVAQAMLPAEAPLSQRLTLLAQHCPALHKLAQTLARDRRLAPELRRRLQQLESLPPSLPVESIQLLLEAEIGPLHKLGVTLAPSALAEASVAIVIPFTRTHYIPGTRLRSGVFKVLKPGIEKLLEEDLEILDLVGSYLGRKCEDYGIPLMDYRELLEQVREKLRSEVRLDQEQLHMNMARALYGIEPRVQIPALLEPCTPRVTAMERVTGRKITEGNPARINEIHFAELLIKELVARSVFSKDHQALFHGDPHPGNLFLTDEDRLAILDWSLIGFLGEHERASIVQIMMRAMVLEADDIIKLIAGLAHRGEADPTALKRVVHNALLHIRRGRIPSFSWLTTMLDEAVKTARLRLGPDMMIFRKSLHTLEGVAADIGAGETLIDGVLFSAFLGCLTAEWPQRWLTLPYSRDYATRLSNADLGRLALSIPWTTAWIWAEQSFDLWRSTAALVRGSC